jgi:hypothetical protein
MIRNTTHENTVPSGASTVPNDGSDPVDVIKFVGGGQGVLEHRLCGCDNGLRTNHYCKKALKDGKYCIQGNESTRICGVHVCILCREKWPVPSTGDESIYQNRCKDHAQGMVLEEASAGAAVDSSRGGGGEDEFGRTNTPLQLPLLPLSPPFGECDSTPRHSTQEGQSRLAGGPPTPLRLSLSPKQKDRSTTTRTDAPPPPVGPTNASATTTTAATQPLLQPPVPPARFIAGQRRLNKNNHFNPVVTVHGTDWFKNDAATKLPMNGPMSNRDFAIKTPIGDTITRSSDRNGTRSRLDYFMLMFPPAELTLVVTKH